MRGISAVNPDFMTDGWLIATETHIQSDTQYIKSWKCNDDPEYDWTFNREEALVFHDGHVVGLLAHILGKEVGAEGLYKAVGVFKTPPKARPDVTPMQEFVDAMHKPYYTGKYSVVTREKPDGTTEYVQCARPDYSIAPSGICDAIWTPDQEKACLFVATRTLDNAEADWVARNVGGVRADAPVEGELQEMLRKGVLKEVPGPWLGVCKSNPDVKPETPRPNAKPTRFYQVMALDAPNGCIRYLKQEAPAPRGQSAWTAEEEEALRFYSTDDARRASDRNGGFVVVEWDEED